MDIGPGDWVECIRAKRPEYVGKLLLVEGLVQGKCRHCSDGIGLVLKGVRSKHPKGAYSACGFRPIYRPKADLIESLKAPPKKVKERTDA